MAKSDDREPTTLSAADEHFRQYERLVSSWIDIFLETQKSVIAHSPSSNASDTRDESVRQEATAPSDRAVA